MEPRPSAAATEEAPLSGRSKAPSAGVDVGLFGMLWAFGLLFHYAVPGDRWNFEHPVHLAAALAFGVLAVRPRWATAWAAAGLLQIADALVTSVSEDQIQMSWSLVAAVHLCWLLILSSKWHLPAERRAQATLDAITPSLRAVVLVVYFYAVLHKLNDGYFSAIHDRPGAMLRELPLVGRLVLALGLETYGAHAGLAHEALILAALLFRRTRAVGVALGVLLHFSLGTIGFRQFLIMFPLLMSFLRPGEAWVRLSDRARWPTTLLVPPLLLGLLVLNEERARGADNTPAFLIACIPFGWELLRLLRRYGRDVAEPNIAPRSLLQAAPALLLAAWCFVPYFGVTSHPCMTMYSRLSVHSGRTNHFFVPAGLQLDAVHGDIVRIVATSAPKKFPVGVEIPRASLRKYLAVERSRDKAPKYVVYRDQEGNEVRVREGYLPDARWYERLPLVSWNGRPAMGDGRRAVKFEFRKVVPRGKEKGEL